jgi:3-dehydroquinate synthetase
MADASVGGKTGINNMFGKNQLGVINDPYKIKVCPQFLQSLDKRNFLNGIAEIIKIAACFDRKLFEKLEKFNYATINQELPEIIKSSINLKLSIVTEDKYE